MISRYPLTEERKALFLKTLAATGSAIAAASAATPWSTHPAGGVNTFRDEARRDPEFAAAWQRAQEQALAEVEQEIYRRAMNPPERPVWHQGQVKGFVEDRNSSDKLLLRLAARLDPAWREHTSIEQSVTVQASVLNIMPQDILLLTRMEQELFVDLLRKIAEARGEVDSEQLPELPAGSVDGAAS
jgi:hypothetical protein